eukprot:COSAG02_NODE_915_length_15986_cov_16.498584_4_plen_2230_part_00
MPPGASGVDQALLADKLLKISVRGAPHQMHTLKLIHSDTVADLNAAVEELGYDLSVDRLCHLGGAPLPHDDRLTLAEAGLKDNTSLQVLGRLHGGVEVPLFGRQHSLGDTGLLDLKGQDVGPAKLKEVAAFFSSAESSAVRRLVLSGNMITDRGKDLSGLKALCEVLPTLKHPISLDLANCGLGAAEVNELAQAIATLNSIALDGCAITGTTFGTSFGEQQGGHREKIEKLDVNLSGFNSFCLALKSSQIASLSLRECNLGPEALTMLADATKFMAALNSLKCGNNLGMVGELHPWGELKTPDAYAEVFKQLTDNLKTSQVTEVDFSSCGIGPVALGHLSEWVRDAEAAVARLILDKNPLTGGTWRDVDKDITGVTSLFDTLKTSSVTELGLAECRLGPGSLGKLAEYVRDAEAALTSMNCLKNPIGDDGLATLVAAVKDSSVRSICGLVEGQTVADFSKQNLKPFDCKIIAAEFGFRGFIAAVARLILDKNPLTGGTWPRDVDKDITGVTSLFDTLKTSSVTELGLAECRLGPGSLGKLAEYVRDAEAAVTSVNCLANKFGEDDLATLLTAIEGTSVRSLCGLTEGQTTADFSGQKLGPIDCKIIAAEYGFRGFIAAVARLILDENPLTGGGLIDVDKDITGVTSLFDTLKTSSVTELGLANCRLGPGSLGKLAEYVREATAAVARLMLDGNPLTGDTSSSDFDKDITSVMALFDSLKTSSVTELGLAKCRLGPGSLGKLAEYVRDAEAALTSINCLANNFGDDDLATLLTAIEGTSIRSLCGLTEGQTSAYFSRQHLKPIDCKIIAAEFGFQGFIAAVEAIAIGANPITSEGGAILLEVVKTSKLKTIDIGKPLPLQEPYESDTLDLSNTQMDPGHVLLLSWWLGTKFSAAVTSMNCLKNPIGDDGLATLVAAVEDSSVRSICGLTEGQTTADFSNQNLEPFDCKIIAAEFGFRGFIAAVASLCCGNNPGMVGGFDRRGRLKIPDAHADVFKELTDSLKTSQVTKADFSSCGLGPVSLGHLSDWVREATTALNSLKCANNPGMVGELEHGMLETPDAHAEVFKQLTDNLKTSQVTEADFSSCGLGPVALGHLSEWVRDAEAAVNCLILDVNAIFDELYSDGDLKEADKFAGGCDAFLAALKGSNIATLSLQKTGIGPVALQKLATSLPAAVASLRCGNNPGMVGKLDLFGRLETPDAHAEVFKELTDSLKTSQVTEADFSSCGIGPLALGHLGEWVREATAASVEVVILDGNPIGAPDVSVKPGATTGVTVKKGVVAAIDGRFGEVKEDPDSDSEVKLRWLDDGSESSWTKVDKLTSVVATRSDLIEDYSHIKSLGEALSGSKVQTYGLANCKFSPATLTTFVESVRWAEAAVEAIAIGANPITSEGGAILLETIKTSKLKTIDIGKPLPLQEPYESDTLDLSDTQMDPGHVLLLSWWLGTEFSAALNSLTLDSTGDRYTETYTLTVGEDRIELSKKHLGSADINLVSAWITTSACAPNRLTVDSTGSIRRTYTLNAVQDQIVLSSRGLGSADVALIGAWLATAEIGAELKSIECDNGFQGLTDDKGNSLLHLVLQHQAPTHVAIAVMEAERTALKRKNAANRTPLEDAIDAGRVVLARGVFEKLEEQQEPLFLSSLRNQLSRRLPDTLGQLVNESKAKSIDAMKQLTAVLDFKLVNDTFVKHNGFAHVLPLLCHPDAALFTVASEAVASACRNDECVDALVEQANGEMARRLVNILVLEKGRAQVHAATALGRVSKAHKKEFVRDLFRDAADADDLLAVLTDSGDATLASLAQDLFKLVASDKEKKKLRQRGLQRMFAEPWPSIEYRKYERSGWTQPNDKKLACDGKDLIGLQIFVEGEGEGTVRGFQEAWVGASNHQIDFVLKGSKQIALERTSYAAGRKWLVQSDTDAVQSLKLIWQRNGGNATTTKMYTRGASKNDVCMWMYSLGGLCRHYAGLFSWIFDNETAAEAGRGRPRQAGSMLLDMVSDESERNLLVKYVSIDSHRAALLEVIGGLAGFLTRYLLAPGRALHKSATCALILAEDRKQENEDGTLKRLALKCMKNLEQFLTELRVRKGLDGDKIVTALRVHVPADFTHEVMEEVERAICNLEPEPEEDGFKKIHARATTAKLFGVDVLHEETLTRDAKKADARLMGQYVIAMECADCDLGSDISHGHYAGRDKTKVRRLLKKIATSYKYCEEKSIIHGDIKCVWDPCHSTCIGLRHPL